MKNVEVRVNFLENFGVSKEKPCQIEIQHGFVAEKNRVRQNFVLQENRVKGGGVPVKVKKSCQNNCFKTTRLREGNKAKVYLLEDHYKN